MRYIIVPTLLLAFLAFACDGDSEEISPTATSTGAEQVTPGVERPDPQTLIPPGYVLDQVLDVSLDGSEPRELVIMSHTAGIGAETAPEECPDNSVLVGGPSPCAFRVEVLAYDAASGWTSRYLQDDGAGEKPGAGGIKQGVQARSFSLDSEREALVLTYAICAASNCVVESHLVLTMVDDEVEVVYDAFQASLQLGPTSATFEVLAFAEFSPGCCPNSLLIQTIGFDSETGEVGVVDAELSLFCTEGTFTPEQSEGPAAIFVRCSEDESATGFETTDDTVVEPATVGGLSALRDGDLVDIEFIIKECPDSLLDCDSSAAITPVATKITVLNP